MKRFKSRVVSVLVLTVAVSLCADAMAAKKASRTGRLEQRVEQQADEIELLKMRLELLEGVVKPGRQGGAVAGSGGSVSPAEITYP